MNRRLLILSLLFISCGKQYKIKTKSTNPIFLDYIKEFEAYYNNNITTPINFGSLSPEYSGVCNEYTNGSKEIIINKNHWDKNNSIINKALIFHELGHCELNKSHKNNYENYCPTSLMNTYIPSEYCLLTYMDNYLDELF